MRLLIIGAGGAAGSRALAEARRRGHHVTPTSRSEHGPPWLRVDTADAAGVAAAARGHDLVISATRPAEGREQEVLTSTAGLASGTMRAGVPLLVIGGASPLRVPGTSHTALEDPRYVPEHIRPIAAASTRQLEVLREHTGTDWTYLAPAAHFAPGPRTGTYRCTDGELVVGPDGSSAISMEDFAIALTDLAETAERPLHTVVGIGGDSPSSTRPDDVDETR